MDVSSSVVRHYVNPFPVTLFSKNKWQRVEFKAKHMELKQDLVKEEYNKITKNQHTMEFIGRTN